MLAIHHDVSGGNVTVEPASLDGRFEKLDLGRWAEQQRQPVACGGRGKLRHERLVTRLAQAGQEVQPECRKVGTSTIAAASFAAVMRLGIIIRLRVRSYGSGHGSRVEGWVSVRVRASLMTGACGIHARHGRTLMGTHPGGQ